VEFYKKQLRQQCRHWRNYSNLGSALKNAGQIELAPRLEI
jgi:hypothetical protein